MVKSYNITDRISVILNIDDISIDIDKAVPCGLLLNELITNAIKHAFPQDRHGKITITLKKTKDENLNLTVHDNGIGLPEGIDIADTKTLGLQLVNILTIQLEGILKIQKKEGTLFTIRFPF